MRISNVVSVALLLFSGSLATAQDQLDVFGYFQVNFSRRTENQEISTALFKNQTGKSFNSFSVQQANIFLRKNVNSDLTAWLNLELKNSYSSERNWGAYNLEEAWIKYKNHNSLNIKVGLLIPKFNNLNEVKNRTPYLPYIFRPLVYESSISELLNIGDYIPERAYGQVYGSVSMSGGWFDYAAFVGNSESEYINDQATLTGQTGIDTTDFVTLGARMGMRLGKIKFGISGTLDRDNQTEVGLGDVKRTRIGTDLSLSLAGFTFEGEYIHVGHSVDSPNISLDKQFYYGTLGYDFTEHLFGYVTYNYIEDDFTPQARDGIDAYYVGAGIRPIDSVVIKAQFIYIGAKTSSLPPNEVIPMTWDFDLTAKQISLATSVFF